jgi:hypothetical protein
MRRVELERVDSSRMGWNPLGLTMEGERNLGRAVGLAMQSGGDLGYPTYCSINVPVAITFN